VLGGGGGGGGVFWGVFVVWGGGLGVGGGLSARKETSCAIGSRGEESKNTTEGRRGERDHEVMSQKEARGGEMYSKKIPFGGKAGNWPGGALRRRWNLSHIRTDEEVAGGGKFP